MSESVLPAPLPAATLPSPQLATPVLQTPLQQPQPSAQPLTAAVSFMPQQQPLAMPQGGALVMPSNAPQQFVIIQPQQQQQQFAYYPQQMVQQQPQQIQYVLGANGQVTAVVMPPQQQPQPQIAYIAGPNGTMQAVLVGGGQPQMMLGAQPMMQPQQQPIIIQQPQMFAAPQPAPTAVLSAPVLQQQLPQQSQLLPPLSQEDDIFLGPNFTQAKKKRSKKSKAEKATVAHSHDDAFSGQTSILVAPAKPTAADIQKALAEMKPLNPNAKEFVPYGASDALA